MPKLPVVTPQKLIKVLEVFGFLHVFGSGSHKVMKHKNGRRTTVPMHGKDIPKGTLLAILRDIEISKEDLVVALKKYL
jgi:predicted RNA binding protein YcfA (HicA-like mRNA interferase family)